MKCSSFSFEGADIPFRPGESVAAALVAAGVGATRTSPVDATPRAPYCLMGACFECLMVIDGVASTQACLVPAAPGMQVARQPGARVLA